MVSKAAVGKVNPKEVRHIYKSLAEIPPIKSLLTKQKSGLLASMRDALDPCEELKATIDRMLDPSPAVQISKGKVIADGLNKELDDLRAIAYSGKDYLEGLQKRESEETGIPSLKIAFNNVFGYYLEVGIPTRTKCLTPGLESKLWSMLRGTLLKN